MKLRNLNRAIGVCSICAVAALAGRASEINEYAVTADKVILAAPAAISVDPQGVTMLAPNLGILRGGIRPIVKNYMILWCQAAPGENQVEWTVTVPEEGMYGVTVSVDGIGSELVVTCNGQQCHTVIEAGGWQRVELGEIQLKAGSNQVVLDIVAAPYRAGKKLQQFKLSALELAKPAVREAVFNEAVAGRQQPDWFKDAGYGLMFQWTNRATPPEGPIKGWQEKVNDFDLDRFVKLVEDSGAAYVVWSMTWGNQYIAAPIDALDAIIAGRTTERDLLGEMTDRLHEKGIRVIFYYHYGYECYHSQDTDWLQAAGGCSADKTKLYESVMSILSEVGMRYGDKLNGWWLDGGARYLNCHFDGTSAKDGILTAPFKDITNASRSGNPERFIAYNSWVKPRVTEYQDYYGGEGKRSFNPNELTNGAFKSGRQQGLQAHGCFTLEKRWGHIDEDTPISDPKLSIAQLVGHVQHAQRNRFPISINLEMYEDGSVSSESYALLKELKTAIRGE